MGTLKKNSLSLPFVSGHIPPQGQGSHSASLSESPGELEMQIPGKTVPSAKRFWERYEVGPGHLLPW